jgi:hypothetical protein
VARAIGPRYQPAGWASVWRSNAVREKRCFSKDRWVCQLSANGRRGFLPAPAARRSNCVARSSLVVTATKARHLENGHSELGANMSFLSRDRAPDLAPLVLSTAAKIGIAAKRHKENREWTRIHANQRFNCRRTASPRPEGSCIPRVWVMLPACGYSSYSRPFVSIRGFSLRSLCSFVAILLSAFCEYLGN